MTMTDNGTAPVTDVDARTSIDIAVERIRPNPRNRVVGDTADIEASIPDLGILEPLIVRSLVDDPGGFEFGIGAGGRRYPAARNCGLEVVPCIVDDRYSDPVLNAYARLTENLAREDVHPLDEGALYEELVGLGAPQVENAQRANVPQSHVSLTIGVNKRLSDRGKQVYREGLLHVKEAEALASLHDFPEKVDALLDEVERNRARGGHVDDWQLRNALTKAKDERELAAATKKAEKAGLRVITADEYRSDDTHQLGDDGLWGVAVTEDDHKVEPCHAVYIGSGGIVRPVCMDWNRHRPSGESELKAPNLTDSGEIELDELDFDPDGTEGAPPQGETQAEREERWKRENEARAQAQLEHQARVAEMQKLVDKRRAFAVKVIAGDMDVAAATALVAESVVESACRDDFYYEVDDAVCTLAGLEAIDARDEVDVYYGRRIDVRAAAHDAASTWRVAVATAAAVAEEHLGDRRSAQDLVEKSFSKWGAPIVHTYVEFLSAHGWKPSKIEKQAIAAGEQVLAELREDLQPQPDLDDDTTVYGWAWSVDGRLIAYAWDGNGARRNLIREVPISRSGRRMTTEDEWRAHDLEHSLPNVIADELDTPLGGKLLDTVRAMLAEAPGGEIRRVDLELALGLREPDDGDVEGDDAPGDDEPGPDDAREVPKLTKAREDALRVIAFAKWNGVGPVPLSTRSTGVFPVPEGEDLVVLSQAGGWLVNEGLASVDGDGESIAITIDGEFVAGHYRLLDGIVAQ